jgi:hypothetical protein
MADPRVEALIAWAREVNERFSEPAAAALEALHEAPPSSASAAEFLGRPRRRTLACPVAGPVTCDLAIGSWRCWASWESRERVNSCGCVSVRYRNARTRIEKTLGRVRRDLGVPAGELEDTFDCVTHDRALSTRVAVGP